MGYAMVFCRRSGYQHADILVVGFEQGKVYGVRYDTGHILRDGVNILRRNHQRPKVFADDLCRKTAKLFLIPVEACLICDKGDHLL